MSNTPAKPFSLSVDSVAEGSAPICVVGLEGYLDAHTSRDFEDTINECLKDGQTNFVLNAENLSYISSAGIGALMRLVQESRRRGGDAVILSPPAKVYGVLELLGFTEILVFADSLDSAVGTLRD